MDLIELVKKLLEHTDRNAVVAAIQTHASALYHSIWQTGHDKAYADAKAKERELDTRIATLTGELTTEREARKQLEAKTPDVASVKAQYESQVAELNDKLTAARNDAKETARKMRLDIIIGDVERRLVGQKFAPKYAKILAREMVEARVKVKDPVKNEYEVMQSKRPDVPVPAPGEGKDLLDVLVSEAVADPENADFILSGVGSGTGTGTRSGAGGGAPKPDDALARQRAAMEAEAKAKPNPLAGALTSR